MSQQRILTLCLAALIGIAGCGVWQGLATRLEAVSFVTGAVCVWLTVRRSVWNFPVGLINVATYAVVFYQARLFADAGLQVVYFGLGLSGWYLWLYGGANQSQLKISRASRTELLSLGLFVAIATLLLWKLLSLVGGAATFGDALTTSLSLAAQWLTNRKKLECWIGWIVVDAIYVPLYLTRDLHLTAVLYALFLVMAWLGWRDWRRHWLSHRPQETPEASPL